jgi:hypothetical protein
LRNRGIEKWLRFAKMPTVARAPLGLLERVRVTQALPEDLTVNGHRLGNLKRAANFAQVLEELISTIHDVRERLLGRAARFL